MTKKIVLILDKFINKEIELEKLQENISSMINSGVYENSLCNKLYDFENKLEEIKFCSLKNNYYAYTADEINKLKSTLNNKQDNGKDLVGEK